MASIDITRTHSLDRERSKAVIMHIADSLEQKFGIVPRWEGETLHFARSGVTGSIESRGSQVHIAAHLGLLLTPLKPLVEAEIMSKLDQYFPAAE